MSRIEAEPRWPSAVAMIAIGGLFYALPPAMAMGPNWLVPVLVAVLVWLAFGFHRAGRLRANQIFGYLAQGVVTLSLAVSLVILVWRLPSHKDTPAELLRAAGALWVSNMLVFASWYWRLDAGGPNQRDLLRSHTDGAFLFPQMVLDPELRKEMGEDEWRPGFVDYLFLAFNTSTAFSPTDVPVLSRWAKVLMMLQSGISLTAIAILAARAVNIL
jgi:hypothetical protein